MLYYPMAIWYKGNIMKALTEDKEVKDIIPRIIDKSFGESKRQMVSIESYFELQKKEEFFKLHYRSLNIVISIKECFPLYFYMCDNITRGKGRYRFWGDKILPYYKKGYLPFAKHQSHIAKDLGIAQSSVSRQLRILLEHDLIARIGREIYSEKKYMDVYSLGRWELGKNGKPIESYYLQSISFT